MSSAEVGVIVGQKGSRAGAQNVTTWCSFEVGGGEEIEELGIIESRIETRTFRLLRFIKISVNITV